MLARRSASHSWLLWSAVVNKTNPKLPSGTPFSVEGQAMGSGEAMQDILDSHLEPAVFSPASDAYLTLLNDAWLSAPGHSAPLAPHSDSVVISPVVIAMWKPMAEAMAEFGVLVSVPSVAEPPDASVIRNLLSLWTRIHQLP